MSATSNQFASLKGRYAIVTGSSSGIGKSMAVEFARAGCHVLVHCFRSVDKAKVVVKEIRELGVESDLLTADISNKEEISKLVSNAFEKFPKLDIWVNNAGVDLLTDEKAKLEYDQKLDVLFETDVRSAVLLSRQVGEKFFENQSGAILNIGWDQADRGMDGLSGELFSTSKNAIMGFSRSLAVSLAPHVRVNCIAPGWIKTAWGEGASEAWQNRVLEETPLKRWGLPEDIARAARFLVSDDANYITGQVINVNGGAVR